MWSCPRCTEDVDDTFALCWNCQANREGVLADFQPARAPEDVRAAALANRRFKPVVCQRCGVTLQFVGKKYFHEEPDLGLLGDVLLGRESLDMYRCPECGHVEFFIFDE